MEDGAGLQVLDHRGQQVVHLHTTQSEFECSVKKRNPIFILHPITSNYYKKIVKKNIKSRVSDPDPHVFALPGSGQKGKEMNE